MNNELKDYFYKFRECSLDIINSIEKEDYDVLQVKIDERQEVLDSINNSNFIQEEINQVVAELGIEALNIQINNLINEKKVCLKHQLEKNAFTQSVNNNYNKSFYNNRHIFSKKV